MAERPTDEAPVDAHRRGEPPGTRSRPDRTGKRQGTLIDLVERDAREIVSRARTTARRMVEEAERAARDEARMLVENARREAEERAAALSAERAAEAERRREAARERATALVAAGKKELDEIARTIVKEVLEVP